MPYCPNCGDEIAAEALSCPTCGAMFGATSAWKPLAGLPPDRDPQRIAELRAGAERRSRIAGRKPRVANGSVIHLSAGVLLAPVIAVGSWLAAISQGYIDPGKSFGLGFLVAIYFLLIFSYAAVIVVLVPMTLLFMRYGRLSAWRVVFIGVMLGLFWQLGLDIAVFGVAKAIRSANEYRVRDAFWSGAYALVLSVAFCLLAWMPLRARADPNFRPFSRNGAMRVSAWLIDGFSLLAGVLTLALGTHSGLESGIKVGLFGALVVLLACPGAIARNAYLAGFAKALSACIPLYVLAYAHDSRSAWIDGSLAALIGALNWAVFSERARPRSQPATA